MARFDANANGEIINFEPTITAEKLHGPPGASVVYSLRFDEETNASLVTAYEANSATFALSGGTLTQNDTPVTINPPKAYYAGVMEASDIIAKANSGQPHNWTTEEIDRIAAVAFRGAGLG